MMITDTTSGETTKWETCSICDGFGGYDISSNYEEYDDWRECEACGGDGAVEVDASNSDTFEPSRDAWTSND